MHWVDVVAADLLQRGRSHVVASGTSISGQIHLGNAGDVIIAEGVVRSVSERGGTASLQWVMDDMDPLRSVPSPLPPDFERHLGMPDFAIPCPEGCCGSFIEHFTAPFVDDLRDVGIEPEVISSADLYRSGRMRPLVERSLERADEIRRIFREVSGSERSDDWLPFVPICGSCGRIATTMAYAYDSDRGVVLYRCAGGVAGKRRMEGCGHEGEAPLDRGKLTWRVDWAARWALLGVTCEPFGKEHSTAGGSYDTSSQICREIFDHEPPYPVPYEHILVGGAKMSKSLGNVVTLREMTAVGTPELSRFFFFRTKATKHKDLEIARSLVPLMESYEWAERVYHGVETSYPEREGEEIRRSYELAQPNTIPATYYQVPFSHLISVVQIAEDWDAVTEVLRRTGFGDVPYEHIGRLRRKVDAARTFVGRYLPEEQRFVLLDSVPPLDPEDAGFVRRYLEVLGREGAEWTPEALHQAVYDAADAAGMRPRAGFRALYRAFLGRDRGPRLGFFLASLDRDIVLRRLGEASGGD